MSTIQVTNEGVVELEEQFLMGTAIRTNNRAESNPAFARIPEHWERFTADCDPNSIEASVLSGPLAAYLDYQSDHRGDYWRAIAYPVDKFPECHYLQEFVIPAGRFLKFSGHGEMPQIVMATWAEIWNYFERGSPHQRAYRVDFEKVTEFGVEVYISIE